MTVCIAALYGDGEGVVLVSDRMVTAYFPIGYEFEHQEDIKIIALDGADSVHVMIAGDVLRGNEILNVAKAQLSQREGGVTAPEATEIIRVAYQKVRLANVVQRELEPRGLDLNSYYGRQQQLAPQIVQMVDQAMCNGDLGVEMLVAGPNGESHTIHTILNPGATHDHTSIGHGAIGSGAPHALYSLIEASYRSSLSRDEVLKLVKGAKQRSEVAPGVGKKQLSLNFPAREPTMLSQPRRSRTRSGGQKQSGSWLSVGLSAASNSHPRLLLDTQRLLCATHQRGSLIRKKLSPKIKLKKCLTNKDCTLISRV